MRIGSRSPRACGGVCPPNGSHATGRWQVVIERQRKVERATPDFFVPFPSLAAYFFKAMAKIPLEDNFTDIIGKAQRGLKLTDEQISQRAGVAVAEFQAAKGGTV